MLNLATSYFIWCKRNACGPKVGALVCTHTYACGSKIEALHPNNVRTYEDRVFI